MNVTAKSEKKEERVKFVPLIVTEVPAGPITGVKLLIVGGSQVTVNGTALDAVPLGVVSEIGPVIAPGGTLAISEPPEKKKFGERRPPPNLTSVTLSRPPTPDTIVTEMSALPRSGERLVTTGSGCGVTMKLAVLVTEP